MQAPNVNEKDENDHTVTDACAHSPGTNRKQHHFWWLSAYMQ